MYAVYINCARYPFIRWILSGRKRYETRTKNVLASLVGQQVYLIETGGCVPMVKGIATVKASSRIGFSDKAMRKAARIAGTTFDIAPNGFKWFYELADVRPVPPFPVPTGRINHGRSYTEF